MPEARRQGTAKLETGRTSSLKRYWADAGASLAGTPAWQSRPPQQQSFSDDLLAGSTGSVAFTLARSRASWGRWSIALENAEK